VQFTLDFYFLCAESTKKQRILVFVFTSIGLLWENVYSRMQNSILIYKAQQETDDPDRVMFIIKTFTMQGQSIFDN